MSTLYRCRDETDDLDLKKYSRRISLRAPPLPNVMNAQLLCVIRFSHLITRSSAPGLDDPTGTRSRLAPAHRDVRAPSASEAHGP
jgi:hypothetical protein